MITHILMINIIHSILTILVRDTLKYTLRKSILSPHRIFLYDTWACG